jgi:hypothetical protein
MSYLIDRWNRALAAWHALSEEEQAWWADRCIALLALALVADILRLLFLGDTP